MTCQKCFLEHPAGECDSAPRRPPARRRHMVPVDPPGQASTGRWSRPAPVRRARGGQPCQICDDDAGEAFLCPSCIDKLERWLADMPALLVELDVTLTRQDNVNRPGPAGWLVEPDPGILHQLDLSDPRDLADARRIIGKGQLHSEPAAHARDRILVALVTAARQLLGDNPWPEEDDQPATVAFWLVRQSSEIARSDHATDTFTDLADARSTGMRAIDTAPERVLVGWCHDCRRPLLGVPTWRRTFCRWCGCEHETAQLLRERDERATSYTGTVGGLIRAAEIYGVRIKIKTFESWIHRDRIHPVSERGGVKQYRLSDALDLHKKGTLQCPNPPS